MTESLFCAGSGDRRLLSSGNTGVWASESRVALQLHMCANASVSAYTTYKLHLDVMNSPSSYGDVHSPAITVEASGTLVFKSTDVDKTGDALFGVEQGRDPFELVVPEFTQQDMAQSTPMATAQNTLTLNFSVSVEISHEVMSVLTISGLGGAEVIDGVDNADGTSIAVVVFNGTRLTEGIFCDSDGVADHGSWVDSGISPKLTIHLCDSSETAIFVSGTELTVMFDVKNPSVEQDAPDVKVGASGSLFEIAAVPIESPAGVLLGVEAGADPMKVVVPSFEIKDIAQTSPFAATVNSLMITLSSNVDLVSGTVITISGLAPATILPIGKVSISAGNTTSGSVFCVDGVHGYVDWGASLLLTICEGKKLAADASYEVRFDVTNPSEEQESPALTIGVSRASARGTEIEATAMITPSGEVNEICPCALAETASLFGVQGGADPLKVVIPVFTESTVAQSTPLVGASNIITVTITSNADLEGDKSSFVEIGGFSVPDRVVDTFHATSGQNFSSPSDVAVAGGKQLFIVQPGDHAVLVADVATGENVLSIGTGIAGFEDGAATSAKFRNPTSIVLAPQYSPGSSASFVGLEALIVDHGNHLIRKVMADGNGDIQVSTLAGARPASSVPASGYVEGVSTVAMFNSPSDAVYIPERSYIVVADSGNHRLRKVQMTTGTVTTLAGSGSTGALRDGAATQARFNSPQGVALSAKGLLLVADTGNHAIRVVDLGSMTVSTLAGSTNGISGLVNGVG